MRRSRLLAFWLISCFWATSFLVAQSPPATCQASDKFRSRVQISVDGGKTWASDSSTICLSPGSSADVAVRTLITMTSTGTQAWSYGLKHNAPWTQPYGGSFTSTGVTTKGTSTATVQNGRPADVNNTAARAGFKGFTQGVVIDSQGEVTLGPTTDFVTARACYRVTAPLRNGIYPTTLQFTNDIGNPPIRSVITQQGRSNKVCAKNLTLNVRVGGCSPGSYPACALAGSTQSMSIAGAQDGPDSLVTVDQLSKATASPPGGPAFQPRAPLVPAAVAADPTTHFDFTRRIPPDRDPRGSSGHIRATPDGKFFVFTSDADFGYGAGVSQIYRVSVSDANVTKIPIDLASFDSAGRPATTVCGNPSISDDGQTVTFDTTARLDDSLDFNSASDVYAADFHEIPPTTRLISTSRLTGESAGSSFYPVVSGDGSTIVFNSYATDLVESPQAPGDTLNVYRFSFTDPTTMQIVSVDDDGTPCSGASGDCQTFESDFSIGRVVNSRGTLIVFQGSPRNPNAGFKVGNFGNCGSSPFQFRQVFLRDLTKRKTFLASAVRPLPGQVTCSNGDSVRPSISADGVKVVFQSWADNFLRSALGPVGDLNGASDIFLTRVDRLANGAMIPQPISVPSQGGQALGGDSFQAILSADGSHVVFVSEASNLDDRQPDNNGAADIFVAHLEDPAAQTTRRMNLGTTGGETEVGMHSDDPDIFLGGRAVVYQSYASNLLTFLSCPPMEDQKFFRDVFESRLETQFVRGDANSDEAIDISDAVFTLGFLYLGGAEPECGGAADTNDDGDVDVSDVVALLNYLFLGAGPLPAPFPSCDFDPARDCLS